MKRFSIILLTFLSCFILAVLPLVSSIETKFVKDDIAINFKDKIKTDSIINKFTFLKNTLLNTQLVLLKILFFIYLIFIIFFWIYQIGSLIVDDIIEWLNDLNFKRILIYILLFLFPFVFPELFLLLYIPTILYFLFRIILEKFEVSYNHITYVSYP